MKTSVALALLTTVPGWVCVALLAGCGQKGPLRMAAPQPSASSAESAAAR